MIVETTGKKFDGDKPRMDLVPSLAIIEIAKVMTFGAKKYGDHNWLGGLKLSRLIAAGLRHIFAWLSGESFDPETDLSHLSHAACCCLMALETLMRRPELDDRYKTPRVEPASTPEGGGRGCNCAKKEHKPQSPPQPPTDDTVQEALYMADLSGKNRVCLGDFYK